MPNIQTPLNCLFYPTDRAGCGHIRAILPLNQLNATYGPKGWFSGTTAYNLIGDPNYLKLFNNIYFQKVFVDHQINYIVQVMNLKRKGLCNYGIFMDLDDLPIEIPDYHFSKKAYLPEEKTIEKLRVIFDNVDVFTTSTQYLKMKMQKIKGNKLGGCNFLVVPNLIPKYLYYSENANQLKNNEKPRIVWAGSNCHFSPTDLGDLGIIYELVKNTQHEFDWVFITAQLPEAFKKMNIKVINWISDIYSYPSKLREIKADFGIAPLLGNEFNKCKSNIKLLEYHSSGCVSLTTNLEPYEKESSLFFSGDWKTDREVIIDTYQNKVKMLEILNLQQKMLQNYWMETNFQRVYGNLFGIKTENIT